MTGPLATSRAGLVAARADRDMALATGDDGGYLRAVMPCFKRSLTRIRHMCVALTDP
jgi:hypothetical protein